MDGQEFKEQLRGFLFDKTDHFVAELICFARSPYDIRGYDANVVYDVHPQVICVGGEFNNLVYHEDVCHQSILQFLHSIFHRFHYLYFTKEYYFY